MRYERPEIKVTSFDIEDVITVSGTTTTTVPVTTTLVVTTNGDDSQKI